MDKSEFKNPKARYSGDNLFQQDEELTASVNEQASSRFEEEPKTHTFTILPSYIDKMRNFVHFKKVSGDPYYTQGNLIQDALDTYFESLEIQIPERPNHVKKHEKKRTGRRRKSGGRSGYSTDLF